MAEKHLLAAIEKRCKALGRPERIQALRGLASGSAEDEVFRSRCFSLPLS
jgi:hypothetical protein